ncbi:MAG: putative RNA methyltransferase [Christensenellales bacterium]
MKFDKFVCPVCKQPLMSDGKVCRCVNGHCFDIAKENYVNLNLSQKPCDKIGDNKEMISARYEFLQGGYYQPLADKLGELADKYCRVGATILDAGCGYGYYICQIADRFKDKYRYLAADISKEGIKKGGKLNTCIDFCIANSYDLPVGSGAIDMLLCVFAPYAVKEIERVLKDDGVAVLVCPAPYHLWQLKRAIYGDKTYPKQFKVQLEPLVLVDKIRLDYDFTLDSCRQINNLLTMTPYYYRTPKDLLRNIETQQNMTVRANFDLMVVKKLTR